MSNNSKKTWNKDGFLGEKLFYMCYSKKSRNREACNEPYKHILGEGLCQWCASPHFISGKPKAVTAFTHLNFRVHEVPLLPVFIFNSILLPLKMICTR